MNRHVYLEATEEGAKLNLPFEIQHKCKVVYKKDPDSKGYIFHSLWDDSGKTYYDDEHIIVPLQSTFGGTVNMIEGQAFSNIIGSSNDPKNTSSWIEMLRLHGCTANECVTDGKFYDLTTNNNITNSIKRKCTRSYNLVGGHVIIGQPPMRVQAGDYNVCLFTICRSHNLANYQSKKVGDGFYMKAGEDCTGIRLANYLPYPHHYAN